MRKVDGRTEIRILDSEKTAFEMCVRKIIKGLFFKKFEQYLDLEQEYSAAIDCITFNIEYDTGAQIKVAEYLKFLNDQQFRGNDVFKYRFKHCEGGVSSLWEILFYDRFPIYIVLMQKDELEASRRSV